MKIVSTDIYLKSNIIHCKTGILKCIKCMYSTLAIEGFYKRYPKPAERAPIATISKRTNEPKERPQRRLMGFASSFWTGEYIHYSKILFL